MKQNYFYICRKHNFVRGLNADYSRVTMSSSYPNGLPILELSRQATDEEIDHHELVFLCKAMSIDDEVVRKKIGRYV